jgi:hypothetical protein
MKTKLCSVLCVMLMSWSITGKTQSFTTFGTPDCGQWIKENSARDKSWLLGYLSGINSEPLNQKHDALNELNSAQQAYLFVDNYCRNNPLHKVSEAAFNLYIELMKKRNKK